MAKKATVTYQLPVEEMHGKLATKQDVTYSGQQSNQTPYDLGMGLHSASSYEQYVVLTKTRGKNRFYVRSRSSIRVTPYTQLSQALMALCSSLAAMIEAAAKARPQQRPYAGILRSYDELAPEGQTLREYLTSLFLEQVRNGVAELYAPFKVQPGVTPSGETIGDNPFAALNTAYNASGITTSFTKSDAQKKVMQKYFEGIKGINSIAWKNLQVVTKSLKKYTIKFPDTSEATSPVTMETLAGYVLGNAYQITFNEGNEASMTIYDGRGRTIASGQIFTDNTGTAVTKSTDLSTLTTIYYLPTAES